MFDLKEHSHTRYNILTGDWILVSPHRTKRPWQGKVEGKIVLKGVATEEDTEMAIRLGLNGIIVSNHGGRQLDAG